MLVRLEASLRGTSPAGHLTSRLTRSAHESGALLSLSSTPPTNSQVGHEFAPVCKHTCTLGTLRRSVLHMDPGDALRTFIGREPLLLPVKPPQPTRSGNAKRRAQAVHVKSPCLSGASLAPTTRKPSI